MDGVACRAGRNTTELNRVGLHNIWLNRADAHRTRPGRSAACTPLMIHEAAFFGGGPQSQAGGQRMVPAWAMPPICCASRVA